MELLRDLEEELDFSPEELDELEGRLDTIYRLKKKYGSTVEEMLDYLERSRQELDQIQYADDTIARLEPEAGEGQGGGGEAGGGTLQARRRAAEALQTRVQEELRQLDMPKVRFQVEFAPKEGAWGLDETGGDEVQFLMSANVGEALKPIQKVASGGELARIMLALKNVLAEDDGIDSLVFDEVDTGVSGRAAQKVAEKMAQVARKQAGALCHPPAPDRRHGGHPFLGGEGGAGRPDLHPGGAAGPRRPHRGAGPAHRRGGGDSGPAQERGGALGSGGGSQKEVIPGVRPRDGSGIKEAKRRDLQPLRFCVLLFCLGCPRHRCLKKGDRTTFLPLCPLKKARSPHWGAPG